MRASRRNPRVVVRASVAKEALAKTLQLRDTQMIVLAQTVGFPKK